MLDVLAQPPVITIGLNDLMTNLEEEIYRETKGIIQAGPFKGMKILADKGWAETNHSAELLGFFEQELHEFIEVEIERLAKLPHPIIANIGCAEGHYAVGLARRLPNATVYVVDPHHPSLRIALANAELNDVQIVPVQLDEAFEAPDYVVMDCEGFEVEYADPERFPGLKKASMIIELHQRPGEDDVIAAVRKHVQFTHGGKIVFEGPRNPVDAPLLHNKSSFERALIMCEWRPCVMCWAILEPAQ